MGLSPDALFSQLQLDLLDVISNTSSRSFAARYLESSFLKKYLDSSEQAESAALDKFRESNISCSLYNGLKPESSIDDFIDSSVRHYIGRHFNLDISVDLDYYDFGPGASFQVKGTSFYHNISDKLSCTSRTLYGMYLQVVRNSRQWLVSERERYLRAEKPIEVDGNKLCFVPKTRKIARSIAVEPSLNMFVQKGYARQLEESLRLHYHIDIEDQQFRNRNLACKGSRDGSYSTIDLSSASDTVSLGLVRDLFPPLTFEILNLIRSPSILMPDTGEFEQLFMISSMGNATTFPLQTIIFSSIVLACYDAMGLPISYNKRSSDGNFGVFGDDIIVLTEAYNVVIRTLRRYGFTPNKTKCFTGADPFRESCGGDYYRGRNVRPVFCRSLSNAQDVYSLMNRLVVWSARHYIPLNNTLLYLSSFVRRRDVPLYEDVSSGFRSSPPTGSFRRGTVLFEYKPLRPRTVRCDIEDHAARRKYRLKYLPECFFLTFLQGSIRDNSLHVMVDKVRCTKRSIFTTVWVSIDRSSSFLEDVSDAVYEYYITEYSKLLEGSYLSSSEKRR